MTVNMENVFRISEKQSGFLPSGFTQLAYISSTGASLFTSVNTILGDKVTVKFSSLATASGNRYIFGQGAQSRSGGASYTNSGDGLKCGWGTGDWVDITLDIDSVNTLEASADRWALNDVEFTGYGSGTFYGGAYSLFRWGGAITSAELSIYSFTVENDSALRCNLIPVIRNSDNAVGMYDLVTNTFLTSTNATNFIAGPIMEVCKIEQNNQTIWERAITLTSNKAENITFRTTRNSTYNPLQELNVYGGTELRKQEKIWSRYIPIQTLTPSSYPMKDRYGRIAVQDIGIDGAKTNTYGYYNETTNTFTQMNDMTGSALQQINYIEATGEQYVLPNLIGNVEWKIVAKGEQVMGTQVLVCSSQTGADGTYIGEFGSYGKWGIGDEVPSTVNIDTKAIIDINFTSSSQYGTINDEPITHPTSAVHNAWALMGTSTGDYCFTGKLYSAQAIVNNEIVRDYIPIKAGGVYCLLDKVNWEIVGSASGVGFNGSSPVIIPNNIVSNNGVMKWNGKSVIAEGIREQITITDKDNAEQYVDAEMLNKVGTHEDVQDIITGDIIKNVGIKMLDGTESIYEGISYWGISKIYFPNIQMGSHDLYTTHWTEGDYTSTTGIYCSIMDTLYFTFNKASLPNCSTANEIQTYLAEQYENNTPVIIVYPLATSTTSTATPQSITINKGTYTAEVTESSLDNLKIQIKYLGNN